MQNNSDKKNLRLILILTLTCFATACEKSSLSEEVLPKNSAGKGNEESHSHKKSKEDIFEKLISQIDQSNPIPVFNLENQIFKERLKNLEKLRFSKIETIGKFYKEETKLTNEQLKVELVKLLEQSRPDFPKLPQNFNLTNNSNPEIGSFNSFKIPVDFVCNLHSIQCRRNIEFLLQLDDDYGHQLSFNLVHIDSKYHRLDVALAKHFECLAELKDNRNNLSSFSTEQKEFLNWIKLDRTDDQIEAFLKANSCFIGLEVNKKNTIQQKLADYNSAIELNAIDKFPAWIVANHYLGSNITLAEISRLLTLQLKQQIPVLPYFDLPYLPEDIDWVGQHSINSHTSLSLIEKSNNTSINLNLLESLNEYQFIGLKSNIAVFNHPSGYFQLTKHSEKQFDQPLANDEQNQLDMSLELEKERLLEDENKVSDWLQIPDQNGQQSKSLKINQTIILNREELLTELGSQQLQASFDETDLDIEGTNLIKINSDMNNALTKLGLQERDVFLRLNGEWIHNQHNPLISAIETENILIISVMRKGLPKTIKVELK